MVLSVIRDLLADAANRRGQPIRNSDFLRRWRPACDGAAERLARDGHLLATATATAPLCLGLRFHGVRHSRETGSPNSGQRYGP